MSNGLEKLACAIKQNPILPWDEMKEICQGNAEILLSLHYNTLDISLAWRAYDHTPIKGKQIELREEQASKLIEKLFENFTPSKMCSIEILGDTWSKNNNRYHTTYRFRFLNAKDLEDATSVFVMTKLAQK